MTKRNRILCLCLAILATAAVAFFLLYPHTTGPVLPRSGDAQDVYKRQGQQSAAKFGAVV